MQILDGLNASIHNTLAQEYEIALLGMSAFKRLWTLLNTSKPNFEIATRKLSSNWKLKESNYKIATRFQTSNPKLNIKSKIEILT